MMLGHVIIAESLLAVFALLVVLFFAAFSAASHWKSTDSNTIFITEVFKPVRGPAGPHRHRCSIGG